MLQPPTHPADCVFVSGVGYAKEDPTFVDDLMNGFPGVGVLPETWHHTEPDANLLPVMEVEQLIAARQDSNESIVSSLTEYEHAEEMHKMTKDDADKGWMTQPRPITDKVMRSVTLSRRIAVVEEREHVDRGWRLRLVDDLTESLVNGATGAKMKIRSQGLDVLRLMILLMSLLGFDVTV